MNDKERANWIDNDEGLYLWWRSLRIRKQQFIREHRPEIDAVIRAYLAPIRHQ